MTQPTTSPNDQPPAQIVPPTATGAPGTQSAGAPLNPSIDPDSDPTRWWATGDAVPRPGCRVEPLVDGRAAMFAMCRAFLSAKDHILLVGWDLRADLPMVRGGDARLGDDDSPQQRALIASLRAEGLDDQAIALWNANQLRVVDVLGLATHRGVKVGVLLWDAFHLGAHITNNPEQERDQLTSVHVDCLLDDSSRRITHIAQSLHQKCAVVDGRVAFVGGVDLTAQYNGDYDRWDTHQHPCASIERKTIRSAAAHPWHDVHTSIEGPAVADVLHNIVQRWTEVALRHHGPTWPSELPQTLPAPVPAGVTAQIARTIPPDTYTFAPTGVATIKELYLNALSQARHYIYLENQYLWPKVFMGLDRVTWGGHSDDAMEVIQAIGAAIQRGVAVAITLPDHPNCGRRITDDGVELLRTFASQPGSGPFYAFTLGNSQEDETAPGGLFYRPIYNHAKIAIIDDHWWTAGSANLNSRGVHSDAELNVAALDPITARSLRLRLWTEHLRRTEEDHAELTDPVAGLAALNAIADTNRQHVRDQQPLAGHILPYLTEADGQNLSLPVHHEHGWLDNLEGGSGGMPEEHAGKYI